MDGHLPQDHSEAILRFGRDHEQAIKQAVVEKLSQFYGQNPVERFEAKFKKGRQEHSPFDPGHDWQGEFEGEAQDAFWYTAIQLWLQEASP